MKRIVTAFLTIMGCAWAQSAQAPNPTQQAVENGAGAVPIYRITVVARTMKAINYNHRSGSTMIGFQGTALMPGARGEAKVESKQGVIKIDAEMQNLGPATEFGPEYLTYVMWAVTPEGRATNVGEVLLRGGKSRLNATSELQSFGLFITAEPYFAVTQPSDVVVMENFVRRGTVGTIEQVDAKFELLQRGQYVLNVKPSEIEPRHLDPRVPLELYEARNAVHIARWTGAETYAADTYLKAKQGLENAEGYLQGKAGRKPIGTVAREAVQMAEDSRIITIRKMDEERLMAARQEGLDRESRAENGRASAQTETDRVTREAARERANARNDAERVKRDNNAQAEIARTEVDRLKRENEASMAASRREAERLKRINDDRASAAQTEVDRLKQENDADRAASQAALDRAARDKAQMELERSQLRATLLLQFNTILQTRDTARGLIVNMSDVLFDTAKFSLRPEAREKLAKVAGIVSGHPGLRLDVEGHTDNVGGDDYNQQLSEQRGSAVRDYLMQQGMPQNAVTTKGLGKTQPVASNDTAGGRQQNRRVELVISGDVIGSETAAPIARQ